MCNKFKTLVLALAVVAPFSAHALSVNLFINNSAATVVKPNSGSITYTFNGMVAINGFMDGWSTSVQFPYLAGGNSDFLVANFNSNYTNALNGFVNTNGGLYSGDLFDITINSTSPIGNYDHAINVLDAPLLSLQVSDSVHNKIANADGSYTVEVQGVPEPATLTLLAIPFSAAVLRRRAKRA